ncbi:type I restriction-modification system methyltransferase subunit [Clostridium sp. CAG:1013]|nr:type I restriction-modification system methyltransferase subunit [Clostridium sp. CAG:1013]
MSEQTIQDNLYSIPVTILDKYTCLSLGATTINDLIKTGKLKSVKVSKNLSKKPDVLIINKNKEVVVFLEFKTPEELNTQAKIDKAIKQEISVAQEIGAKIYVVTDGDKYIWLNPTTGNLITDENGTPIIRKIDPKAEPKKLAEFIDLVSLSVSSENDTILRLEDIDPTDLAKKIARILKRMTFASSKMSLYTFVEVFLFKYLSDINVLKDRNSFSYIYSLYSVDESTRLTNADILGAYLEGPRAQMKMLFPDGEDGTTIVNGQIFHVKKGVDGHYIEEDAHAMCFKNIMDEFYSYEKENGKFINISKDFKSKLFETFMKNSDDKSDMGQFFTPLKIVREMVNMVTISNGMKICDPASGVGKFLLEAAANVPFEMKNGQINSGVELYGFEKQMSGKDDITTILAKANMLIYFSKLFKDNSNISEVQLLAENLLNKTFTSSKTALGTLGHLEENKYDLILANPPYYQDSTISKLAAATGYYKAKGNGVEALFLEWIVRSLKYGGTANIVLPDGIFTNLGNTELKKFILRNCFIESIISLPINSFFNTPKKTYILTLRKKSEDEIDNNINQTSKIFCYICKSIGETLDTYRFDTPDDNDLHEAVNKYNSYKNLPDKNNIQEPFKSWFENDGKLKLIPILSLPATDSWNIDSFWSDDEKIQLGFKKADETMTVDEFKSSVDELIRELNDLKEAVSIECSTTDYKDFLISDLYTPKNGSSTYTKEWCQEHQGDIPLYSGNTFGAFDHIDVADYDGEYITWAKDGLAGYTMYHNGKFSLTGHRGILIPKGDHSNIDVQYMRLMIEPIFRRNIKGRLGINGKNEYTTLNSAMIKAIKEKIQIPIKADGSFDLDKQKDLAQKFATIEGIKENIRNQIEALTNIVVI